MNYLVWEANPAGGFCTLEYLKNVDDPHELKRGTSRIDGFPSNACFHMDKSHPKEIKLPDNIYNLDRMVVVSRKLKKLVEDRKPLDTEFLPVTIVNHKGRVASEDYFIVNPYRIQECIELDKSDIDWNPIDAELISSCFELVIDKARIDPELLLFRPKHMPTIVMAREDLVKDIISGGFSGIHFVEIDEFEL